MPRDPRVHLDGIPLHIVQRGHNREPCFFAEEDYFSYLHWLGYRANALGQADSRITQHDLYRSLGKNDLERQLAYRALFRSALDQTAISDIRLAMNQNQPLGNARFLGQIEKVTGTRREARPRGRPPVQQSQAHTAVPCQTELKL